MYKNIINDVILKLDNILSANDLSILRNVLLDILKDYDITKKNTEVAVYHSPFPKFYQNYMVTRKIEGLSDESLKLYKLYLEEFFNNIGKPIEKLNADDIRIYLYDIQSKRQISNRTLDSRRSVLNAFFTWSVGEGYLSKNPCSSVRPIKYERIPKEPLKPIELEQIRNTDMCIRDKAIIEFLFSTGCRVTELVRLNISDVNLDTKEVVLFGKGNKHRKSYINAKSELALKQYLSTRKDNNEALFVTRRKPNVRMKKGSIEALLKTIEKHAKLDTDLYPHKLRRSTACSLLSHDVPITDIQKLLGHENINTTMIYAKVSDTEVKHNHDKFMN